MPEPDSNEITRLLARAEQGDADAWEELVPKVHAELRSLAAGLMGGQAAGHTLQPTALVNEAWIRLSGGEASRWTSRQHFLKAAAKAMRSVLIDHARRKASRKREGPGERVPLDEVLAGYERLSIDLLALDEGLAKLETLDAELSRIVELRFFAGLSIEETARVLGVATPTVERRWRAARALLHLHLTGEPFDGR